MTKISKFEGTRRVVIEAVRPEVDGGRFPVKRVLGDNVNVQADIFTDGHDAITCELLYRKEKDRNWSRLAMEPRGNDVWEAAFQVQALGPYRYTVSAWIDHFKSWRKDLKKRIDAVQSTEMDLRIGISLVEDAAERAKSADAAQLRRWSRKLKELSTDQKSHVEALDTELLDLVSRHSDRSMASTYSRELQIFVDRPRARFSSWYEIFPRSCVTDDEAHGTLADCAAKIPEIAAMGFDVLYLPPIHPIGKTFRKGKNNLTQAALDDVGSPWAIGSEDGGHKSIEPKLGTLNDFRKLVKTASEFDMEIAMDIAFQCSPDHPYVLEHPQWFRHRPDGAIQYAENPPKKYQDIYPLNFETEDWEALWDELLSIVLFWAEKGIRIFRVDNPHTKPFAFWEWLISSVREIYPEALFLSEAFTRPKVKYRLAKLGFTQSYTYFTWRNTKEELIEYITEITQSEYSEFFRPNLWPNTPDILPEFLQLGGRPAFMIRLSLAATLGSNYGIYGPAFELCESAPRAPGSEEYLHSEKYEIRKRNQDDPWSLREFIARINQIRRENCVFQDYRNVHFHRTDNPMLICYSKTGQNEQGESIAVLVVVNLDYQHTQNGWVHLDLQELGLDEKRSFQAHDLLGDSRFLWQGSTNYVELNPHDQPAHILRIRQKVRTEHDFDYYL